MAAPTTKAKRGGEWETAENVGCQEVERLKKKPSTRLNSKLIATEKKGLAIVQDNLYQQYCRWERSGVCALRRMYVFPLFSSARCCRC